MLSPCSREKSPLDESLAASTMDAEVQDLTGAYERGMVLTSSVDCVENRLLANSVTGVVNVPHDICFDTTRPYGPPLNTGEWCDHGSKHLQMHTHSDGYHNGLQLSSLKHGCFLDWKHVVSLDLTGMEYYYGYNAISVVVEAADDGAMVAKALSFQSQFYCPWANTRFTLVIDALSSTITTYAQPSDDSMTDIDATPFFGHCTPLFGQQAWTMLGNGLSMRVHSVPWLTAQVPLPGIGIRMAGCYNNRVTIVPSSTDVIATLSGGVVSYM